MDEHEHYKQWMKKRKFTFWVLFLRLPLGLAIIPLFLTSISAFICLIAVCAIVYFWVDLGEDLKGDDVLTKSITIGLIITGSLYLMAALIMAYNSVFYACIFIAISTVAYVFFKMYRLYANGIKNKKLVPQTGILFFASGLILATTLFFVNQIFLGYLVAAALITYGLSDTVVKFVVEKDDTNRILK
ncbi:hypothetical protein [uncultured Lactobacillus sp.]|uniref:hypothetical protein n=1 Tax=uncultured Lactobacillus sp. TaxID=153152 RepID=UPI0026227A80|nr:hypothetical protein [uncultured Lactobacillus sp.]